MSYKFKQTQPNPFFPSVDDVSPQEVLENKNSLYLVDVRELDEYHGDLGHVAGAKLISLGDFSKKVQDLPHDQTLVIICRSGGRSAQATAYAKQLGYSNIYNMAGGMLAWNQFNLPTEK